MALVVANMIGTGVFTSLGFQVIDIQNTWSILLLWTIGGVVALTGAFSYAELGAYFRRSGGEYTFLSEAYHPIVGYLAGWISLTVGFAAPVGLAAMAMGSYLSVFTGVSEKAVALAAVMGVSLVHSFDLKKSSRFQNIVTVLKVLLIAGITGAGLFIAPSSDLLELDGSWVEEVYTPAFAVALVFVTYSYSGWNAAAYIVDEIRDVSENLPKALIRGTLVVTLLYVLLHFVFLKHTPIELIKGEVEIGRIFADRVFGENAGKFISGLIAFFLLSGISAMVWVGPRVSMAMGEDHAIWRFLRKKNSKGIPVAAVWFGVEVGWG
jgi:APA family basic amino acid/polyamine antiporter